MPAWRREVSSRADGLDGEDDVTLGFAAVADGHGAEAGEGAFACFKLPEHRLDAVGGGEFLEVGHLAGERIRDDAAAGQGEEFVEDGGHADDGGEGQRDHEQAAFGQEIPGGFHRIGRGEGGEVRE